jgi:hypothetical protein
MKTKNIKISWNNGGTNYPIKDPIVEPNKQLGTKIYTTSKLTKEVYLKGCFLTKIEK